MTAEKPKQRVFLTIDQAKSYEEARQLLENGSDNDTLNGGSFPRKDQQERNGKTKEADRDPFDN